MIPPAFIQDLLHRVDIVDVIDRHVKLKRAGANFVACCPFHSEKTPSFTVSQPKQFYHCFGCGAHGTAISFMMEYGAVGFIDAVKDLAGSVGMTVPEAPRTERAQQRADETGDLHELLLTASRFYRARLKDAPQAIEYLKRRGLSGEIAREFGIGYAPDGWQNLAAVVEDYSAKDLAAAGLVKQTAEGRRYDLFRDRIMFPIIDVKGKVIGFGGRVLDSGEPKYLNSPETPVFEKGRELYGLFQARRAIRDSGRVLVVEGYMDVVALAQHGVGYAVATLGTATTGVHVQKLLRQTDHLVFCFDGDTAGRKAAWRALESTLPELTDGKQVSFLFLPQGEDPDSYIRAHGREQFESLIGGAVPLSRYLLDELSSRHDLAAAEGRAALVHDSRPLVTRLQKNAFRAQIVRELAERTRLGTEEVAGLLGLPRSSPRREANAPARVQRVAPSLWRKLLQLLIDSPELAGNIDEHGRAWLRGHPDFAPAAALIELIDAHSVTSTAALFEAARGSAYAEIFQSIGSEIVAPIPQEEARLDLEGILVQLEKLQIEGEYAALLAKTDRSVAERARLQYLMNRFAELKGARAVG